MLYCLCIKYFSKYLIHYKNILLFLYFILAIVTTILLLKLLLNYNISYWVSVTINIRRIYPSILLIYSIAVRNFRFSRYLEYILYKISIKITQSLRSMLIQKPVLSKFYWSTSNIVNSSIITLYTSKYSINS